MLRACSRRFLLCVAFVLSGCGGRQPPPQDSNEPVAVTAEVVRQQQIPLAIETVGRTEGSKEVELRARVSGILEKQVYSEGSAVKAGAVLFRIDPVPFEIALQRARAALAQARATQQQARRNADRLTTLLAQNAVSRRDADDALSALEASEAAVLVAQAEVRDAEVNLSYTRVTAPIGGIAGRAHQSEGTLLTAGTDSSLLTTLTQTDPIWVRFALSVAEYTALRAAGADDPAALAVELLGGEGITRALDGRVNFAASIVDPAVGTVQLRAEFTNPKLLILPGEYLRVRLSGGAVPAITVPQAAVLQGAQGPFVWIVDAQGQAERREVQTGAWVGERWHIRDGLVAGDTVILDNLLRLRAGTAVKWQAAGPPGQHSSASPASRPGGV